MTIRSRPITSAAMEGLSNCPLMKLPFEIRQSIYDLYYAEASDLVFGVTNSNRLRVHLWCKGLLNLPLVCKELYVASVANLPPSALIGKYPPKDTPKHSRSSTASLASLSTDPWHCPCSPRAFRVKTSHASEPSILYLRPSRKVRPPREVPAAW